MISSAIRRGKRRISGGHGGGGEGAVGMVVCLEVNSTENDRRGGLVDFERIGPGMRAR